MEFWGVEVKPGQTVKCEPGEDKLIHLSQAALGETKNKGTVPVYVKVNNQKLVIGTLSSEQCAQISYDLVFEKEFELSHTSKNASVHFCGYKTDIPEDDDLPGEDYSEFDSEEEDVQLGQKPNGKPEVKALDKEQGEKPKAKKKQEDKPKAVKEVEEDDDDDDDSDDDFEVSDDDKDMADAMADSDDDDDSDDEDDDDSDDEDEETPKKTASGKKRPAESATKTPVPEKKAKLVSPAGQKTGGNAKKSGHVATPHPAKQAAKTPANSDKSKQQSPKSGSVSCKSCSKSFSSENGLQAHTKAKHSDSK